MTSRFSSIGGRGVSGEVAWRILSLMVGLDRPQHRDAVRERLGVDGLVVVAA